LRQWRCSSRASARRARPELALPGGGAVASSIQLVAGLLLVLGAVGSARRGESALAGALLVACAGLGLRALPAPPDGSLLFTLALVGAGVAPAAAAHVALLHPGGRPAGGLDRLAAASGYAVHAGVAGLFLALVFDPKRAGCFTCPVNLLLVHGAPALADWLSRAAPRAMAVTEGVLAVLVAVRLAGRPMAARSVAAPVSAAAIAVLALTAVVNLRAAEGLARQATDRDLWLAAATALGALAAGLGWRPLRAARLRGALGRLTVAASASVEDVRAELARALGDPALAFVLPHPETGEPITLDGTAARVVAPGRERTPVERRAASSRGSSIAPTCARSPSCLPRSPGPPRWRSSGRRCTWRSGSRRRKCARPPSASSRPARSSGDGSSATCTTARSSACSPLA
jgi:hypothetical protein